jgi:X-linked retinitis pigmentosa GTPase regulator
MSLSSKASERVLPFASSEGEAGDGEGDNEGDDEGGEEEDEEEEASSICARVDCNGSPELGGEVEEGRGEEEEEEEEEEGEGEGEREDEEGTGDGAVAPLL